VESRGACCGDVSPDVPEDGPALDMSAAAGALLLFLRSSTGVAGASGSLLLLLPPRAFLGFRVGCACDGGSGAALRLRDAGGGRALGGEPASVAVDGEACVVLVLVSALSLAADERVTLCDMGKCLFHRYCRGHTAIASGMCLATLVSDRTTSTVILRDW